MSWLFNSTPDGDQAAASPPQMLNFPQMSFPKKFDTSAFDLLGPHRKAPQAAEGGSSSSQEGGAKAAGPAFNPMNDFVSALQTDIEAGIGELKEAGAGMGAMFKELGQKVASSTRPVFTAQHGTDPSEAKKREEAKELLQGLRLEGCGPHALHTCTIKAMSKGRLIGDVDDKYIQLEWYRALPGGSFHAISQVKGGVYKPSADDIGARICLRGCLVPGYDVGEFDETPLSAFREVGPLVTDPEVESDYLVKIREKVAIFTGLRDPKYPLRTYELVLDGKGLMLMEGDALGEEEEESRRRRVQEEVLGRWAYSPATKVALHAGSVTVLAIQVPEHQEGEPSPKEKVINRRVLVCESRHQRDVIALVWRQLRREALGELQGEAVDDSTLQEEIEELMDLDGSRAANPTATTPQAASSTGQVGQGEWEEEAGQATQVLASSPSTTSSQPPKALRSPASGKAAGGAPKKRAVSDSLLYIDPRWRKQGLAGEKQSPEEAIAGLAAGLEGGAWGLEGQEKQIAQLSNQLALVTVELDSERARRAAAEEQTRRATAEAASLRTECVGLQARVSYLERAAAKMTVQHAEAKALADDCMAKAAALQEQLDKCQLDEHALSLKVTTNEEAAVVVREELREMAAKLDDVQAQKEKERRYFVTSLEDRDTRLERADAQLIELEAKQKDTQAMLDKALSEVCELEAEVTALRSAREQLGGVQGDLQTVREACEQAQAQARQAGDALEASRSKLTALTAELEAAKAKASALLTERNSFKNRAESLSREMARVTRLGRSLDEIEELIGRLPEVEAEKKRLVEELDELKDLKLSTSLSFSSSAAGGGGGGPSSAVRKGVAFFKLPSNADEVKREQVSELQRLILNLTESVHDKDTQLETQREMNRRLVGRIARLEALLAEKGGTLSDDDEEDDEDSAARSASRQSSLSNSDEGGRA